jgi:hypothetical protein
MICNLGTTRVEKPLPTFQLYGNNTLFTFTFIYLFSAGYIDDFVLHQPLHQLFLLLGWDLEAVGGRLEVDPHLAYNWRPFCIYRIGLQAVKLFYIFDSCVGPGIC